MTREEEISRIMKVQQGYIDNESRRLEEVRLSFLKTRKAELLSGELINPHFATCRECCERVVDLLPVDTAECERLSHRSGYPRYNC